MVFEALYKSKDIEAKPHEMLIYTIIATFISVIMAHIIFPSYESIVSLFLLTISVFPVIHRVLEDQEHIDEYDFRGMSFFEKYRKTIEIYSYYFLGVIIAVSLIMSLFPSLAENVFQEQMITLKAIRGIDTNIQGNMILSNYLKNSFKDMIEIFYNNMQVSFISFMLSFFFGTGAVFILAWNASVIGVFASTLAKELASSGHNLFMGHIIALLSISLHGIPEVLAYFLAGIAGGILSVGIVQGENRRIIIIDAFKLFLLSLIVLFGAAFIEAFVTPIL